MTQFAMYIKDYEPAFTCPNIHLGLMECQERLTQEELKKIRDKIRMKYCEINQEARSIVKPMEVEIEGVSKHEMV